MIKLRPYQEEIARAILDSILNRRGFTFSVEIARQGGKNELSAMIELILLTLYMDRGGSAIKASPTFKPQTIISMERLKRRLDDFGFSGIWRTEMAYIIGLGSAKQIFLSADESANVVGHTADILLEIDESQDVSKEKYSKEFRPMGSSTNVTTVHYGTTWDDTTLLEEVKQGNLELEKLDGIKRHFRYDWQHVARYNHDYLKYVESEQQRLGKNHPLFLTQYALEPLQGGGGFLSMVQRAQL
jgi:SpoVK/Ycf46/Vps4 family AAA+-type ATPase